MTFFQMEMALQPLEHQCTPSVSTVSESDNSDLEDNMFTPPPPPQSDRRWESGFKVDIPEFHGYLQEDEFL